MHLTRRSKIISIRVSPEEYAALQTLSIRDGNDSISDLARKGMKLLIRQENANGEPAVASRVNDIDTRMTVLDREIERLSTMMGLTRLGSDSLEQQ